VTGTMLDIHDMRHELMATYINVTVALQIRAMREARGWSQDQLAKELGTSQAVISGLEQVRWKHWPQLSTLLDVAKVFDVALLARFCPWTQLIEDFMRSPGERKGLSYETIAVSNWEEEFEKMAAAINGDPTEPESPAISPWRCA
jgi:transcriptional regulator with XRE-family HTH domain